MKCLTKLILAQREYYMKKLDRRNNGGWVQSDRSMGIWSLGCSLEFPWEAPYSV